MPCNVFFRRWLHTREQPWLASLGLGLVIVGCLVGNAAIFWLTRRGAAQGQAGFGDALRYSVTSITIQVITSYTRGDTLSATTVAEREGAGYQAMAKALLDRDASLLNVIRSEETFTTFRSVNTAVDDLIIYVAQRRYGWDKIQAMSQRNELEPSADKEI